MAQIFVGILPKVAQVHFNIHKAHPGKLDLVEWVLFDKHTYSVYEDALNKLQVSKIVHSPRLDEINRMLRDGLI